VERLLAQALGDLPERFVAPIANRTHDLRDRRGHLLLRWGERAQAGGQARRVAPVPVDALDLHLVASRILSASSSTSAARSLWATRLATRRAVQVVISSRTSSSFSASVRPVSTRSTIPSARPTRGASSTEPLTSITSARLPASWNQRSVARGYLVAMRIAPRRRS